MFELYLIKFFSLIVFLCDSRLYLFLFFIIFKSDYNSLLSKNRHFFVFFPLPREVPPVKTFSITSLHRNAHIKVNYIPLCALTRAHKKAAKPGWL